MLIIEGHTDHLKRRTAFFLAIRLGKLRQNALWRGSLPIELLGAPPLPPAYASHY